MAESEELYKTTFYENILYNIISFTFYITQFTPWDKIEEKINNLDLKKDKLEFEN